MSPLPAPLFVLGCGRLGSTLTPLDEAQSLAFVRRAYELGVRHFDTASIYGQGDSERLLGRALQPMRAEVHVATKAGQTLSPKQRLLRPFKPLIRSLLRRRATATDPGAGAHPAVAAPAMPTAAASLVAAQRAQGVPSCFEPAFVLDSLRGSLRRLRSDQVELFYLHSPSPQVLARPELWQALGQARQQGLFGRMGVSCDDLATAEAALGHEDVQVIQFEPDGSVRAQAVLDQAAAQGVQVYARLGSRRWRDGAATLRSLLAAPAVRAVVMGTTQVPHLEHNLRLFADARQAQPGAAA